MNKKIRNEVQRAREDDEENVRWSTHLINSLYIKKKQASAWLHIRAARPTLSQLLSVRIRTS